MKKFLMNNNEIVTKGQIIYCLVGVFIFFKKRMKKSNLTTMVPQVELFSFVFWNN